MEMARHAAFTNLNLGGTPRNQHNFDRTRTGIVSNMYPDTVGPGVIPSTPIVLVGRMDTIPMTRPPTKAAQAGDGAKEIYDRYITTTNQDTSPDSLIPVVYQLRLEKIARSYRNLKAEGIASTQPEH